MTALAAVLARSYFPTELPPPFNTRSLGEALATGVPASFELVQGKKAYISYPVVHNLARVGTLRRKLSLPNPVNQCQVAKEVINGWKQISRHCRASPCSLTTPRYSKSGRALVGKHPFSALPTMRAAARAGRKVALLADTSSFYPSLYTHSIPWALHGKALSKSKPKDLSLLGNRLDLAIRNGQGQQTVGVPIGPDTSLVIAEIVASAMDRMLSPAVQDRAMRFVDDFECGFSSTSQADSALTELQNILGEYELMLNPKKTGVKALPLPLEAPWVGRMRTAPLRQFRQREDLLAMFSLAFELAAANPEETVLKWAIRKASAIELAEEDWPLYQDLLLSSLAVEPGAAPSVAAELSRVGDVFGLDKERVSDAFNCLISDHAPRQHGSEVAWCVWSATANDLRLAIGPLEEAIKMPDPVVSLCLLHARAKGLVPTGLDWSLLESRMTSGELQSGFWLLSYEAWMKGWLPSFGASDHIGECERFSYLRANDVSFYDEEAGFGAVEDGDGDEYGSDPLPSPASEGLPEF